MVENGNLAEGTENSVLKLEKGDAYKIKIEDNEGMVGSPFRKVYLDAFSAFLEIENDNNTKYRKVQNLEARNVDRLPEFSNLIAFCGERGSGKTSAMVSFRNLLDGWGNKDWRNIGILDEFLKLAPATANCYFLCLDTVDPSRFEPHDRLIGSILGELYRRFERMISSNCDSKKHDQQRAVESAFRDVHEAVQLLSNSQAQPFGTPGAGENPFDILRRAGKAASMRELVHNLVKVFLEFAPSEKDAVKYLVIPVDDLDMSVQHAYVLAEDIRKYFLIPNVVVLLAAKVDQLRMAVEQSYVERFEHYMKRLNKPDANEIESMSNLYLEKLVPLGRRLNMPDFSRAEIANTTKIEWTGSDGKTSDFYPRVVKRLIWNKTGLVFLEEDGISHPIVPSTLRELHNFLDWIESLKPFDHERGTGEGLLAFRKYLISEWVPRNLDRDEEQLVSEIESAPAAEKNRRTISIFARLLNINIDVQNPKYGIIKEAKEWLKSQMPNHINELERLSKRNLRSGNVSLGDVRYFLSRYQELLSAAGRSKLVFAAKTILSIDLVMAFDRFKGKSFLDVDSEERMSALIGGSFVNPSEYPMYLPKNYLAAYSRTSSNSKKNQFPVSELEGRVAIVKKIGDLTAGRKIEQLANEKAKNTTSVNPDELLWMSSLMMYFGNSQDYFSLANAHKNWFDAADLHGIGSPPTHFNFDFWAFLFWIFVPRTGFKRIVNSSDLENVDPPEFLLKFLNSKSSFLRQVIQIEVLDFVEGWMNSRYSTDQRYKFKRSPIYNYSGSFDWALKNFIYACSSLSVGHRSYLVHPPLLINFLEPGNNDRTVTRGALSGKGVDSLALDQIERESNLGNGQLSLKVVADILAEEKFIDWVKIVEPEIKDPDLKYYLVLEILAEFDSVLIKEGEIVKQKEAFAIIEGALGTKPVDRGGSGEDEDEDEDEDGDSGEDREYEV